MNPAARPVQVRRGERDVFRILHRMIFMELFRIFFLCWIGLTGMILLGGIIAEATQQGLGPAQILEIIPMLVPNTMPYTLPTATLFATCVVYGRLACDNEILAVKAAGINLGVITLPAIVLGAIASVGTFILFLDVIPSSQWEAKVHFVKNVEELLYAMLRKEGFIHHPQLPYTISVQRVEGRILVDAIFKHIDATANGGFDVVARSKKADLRVDPETQQIIVHMWNGRAEKNGDINFFEEQEFPIDLPPDFSNPKKQSPSHMTWQELEATCLEIEADRKKIEEDKAVHEMHLHIGAAPGEFAEHVRSLNYKLMGIASTLHKLVAEYQIRPALSLGCLCFVLVGCPVGIWFGRKDYLSSFITCFLPIVLIYYPLMLCGMNLAKSGKVPALIAVWPANLVLAGSALVLFRKLLRN
jgi:lipopolysaccharide export system permease protein